MTILSQFADWLALARRDGQGGLDAEPPAIIRGRRKTIRFTFEEHPDYGDWTGGTFAAVLRASPGAAGAALATYTCTTGTPAGGETPVTLTLAGTAQGSLPASNPADGYAEVFFELIFTPTGVDPVTLVSTRQLVREPV